MSFHGLNVSLPFPARALKLGLMRSSIGRKERTGPPTRGKGCQPSASAGPGYRCRASPGSAAEGRQGLKTPHRSPHLWTKPTKLLPPPRPKRRGHQGQQPAAAGLLSGGPASGAADPEILWTQSGSLSQFLPRGRAEAVQGRGSRPPTGLVTDSGAKSSLGSCRPPSLPRQRL